MYDILLSLGIKWFKFELYYKDRICSVRESTPTPENGLRIFELCICHTAIIHCKRLINQDKTFQKNYRI